MKTKKRHDEGFHRPFAELKRQLQMRSHAETPCERHRSNIDVTPSAGSDREMFLAAMEGVVRLDRSKYWMMPKGPSGSLGRRKEPDEDGYGNLRRLILTGEGFDVSLTPEYIEGASPDLDPHVPRLLHRGKYAIQAHLDLHGFTAREARLQFDRFMEVSLREGLRTVLIIHGRGLSSPKEPVLKRCLQEWILRSSWRRWVSAYCTARSCDGGAGATVLLLRKVRSRRKGRTHGR